MTTDRNCLSYWFPRLLEAGIPVPKTEIVRTDVDLTPLCDGKLPNGWGGFLAEINVAIGQLTDNASPTPPIFLRTGQTSGKHQWSRCCYVDFGNGSLLQNHVAALVEWSHIVDFIGLPHDVWCVRELLPTKSLAVLPNYGGFPLVKEIRGFVKDGEIVCYHPYWPAKSIEQGFSYKKNEDPWEPRERDLPENIGDLVLSPMFSDVNDCIKALALIERVAKVFKDDGAWSVDVLWTDRGLYITDMAEASQSFHYEGCLKAKELLGV